MNNYKNKFPIYRDATQLVVAIEKAVKVFPRYHKYTLGSEMRKTAYDLLIAISYAINNVNSRKSSIKKAHQFSEVLKIKIGLANITQVQHHIKHLNTYLKQLQNNAQAYIFVSEQGYVHNRLKQRKLRQLFIPNIYTRSNTYE